MKQIISDLERKKIMNRIYYKDPANWDWEKALPIGNGRLGAMVFGEADMEHYQLNEESVWGGGPMERINPDAKANLEKVRELIFAGKIPEAERLLKFAFTGTPQSQRPYQTLGDLYIDLMGTIQEAEEYERELDLTTAIHKVTVRDKLSQITYDRECFVSAPDQVIVTRLTAKRPTPATGAEVRAGAMLTRSCMCNATWTEGDMVFLEGSTNCDGIDFCAGLKMCVTGGEATAIGEHIVCHGAKEIVILLAAATSYREKDIRRAVKDTLNRAGKMDYDTLRQRHVVDYQRYANTCELSLDYDTKWDQLPTDERLAHMSEDKPDLGLINTYFAYGRYLLISSSRPGTLPANLQGIWNADITPPWGSKFTININTQMNYWPAETLGLSECHLPLFEHLKKMERNG